MTKREVVRSVFAGQRPPYVPWHYQFTKKPWELLCVHCGGADAAEAAVDNHILDWDWRSASSMTSAATGFATCSA